MIDDVHPASLEDREREALVLEERRGLLVGGGVGDGEGIHAAPPARAARTLSGVSGRERTGLPIAFSTAHAMAPEVGIVGGSPMERTPVWFLPQSTGSMCGMSRVPRIL